MKSFGRNSWLWIKKLYNNKKSIENYK